MHLWFTVKRIVKKTTIGADSARNKRCAQVVEVGGIQLPHAPTPGSGSVRVDMMS